jgi:hypothetical protein
MLYEFFTKYNKEIYIFLLLVVFIVIYFWFFGTSKLNVPKKELLKVQKIKVYNFNTRSCGWSVKFQPQWDLFMEHLQQDPTLGFIEAYDVKCDESNNLSMCQKYNVPGFPYVVIEANGEYIEYPGNRTAVDIINHIHHHHLPTVIENVDVKSKCNSKV